MKALPALLLLAVSVVPALAYGETLQEIELIDGSIVWAEVVSMNRGMYRLRSETLGEIEVPAHRIKAIRSSEVRTAAPRVNPEPETMPNSPLLATPVPPETPSADDLQQMLMQDPAAMSKVLSLQDDPLVQSILSDEDTMQAIEAGDIGALLNNPKIKALMRHPTVQELSRSRGE